MLNFLIIIYRYSVILPDLTEDLSRVSFVKIRNLEISKEINHYDFTAHFICYNEIRMREVFHLSDILVIDAENYSKDHLRHFVPSLLQKSVKFYQVRF